MVNGVPREVPRHSIHHDTPKAFPYNVILSASQTSKEAKPNLCLGSPLDIMPGLDTEY